MTKFLKNIINKLQLQPFLISIMFKILNIYNIPLSGDLSQNYKNAWNSIFKDFKIILENVIIFIFLIIFYPIFYIVYFKDFVILYITPFIKEKFNPSYKKFLNILYYFNTIINFNDKFLLKDYLKIINLFFFNKISKFFNFFEGIHPLKTFSNFFFSKFEKIVFAFFDSYYFNRFIFFCEYAAVICVFIGYCFVMLFSYICDIFEIKYFFLKKYFSEFKFSDFFNKSTYINIYVDIKNYINEYINRFNELEDYHKKKIYNIFFFISFFILFYCFINIINNFFDFIFQKTSKFVSYNTHNLDYHNQFIFWELKFDLYNLFLPLFFYFFILFIFTNIFSFLFLSFLGLYGIFIINLITLILFWISLIFYLNNFFVLNDVYNINLGKWFLLNLNFVVNFDLHIDVISFSFMFLTTTIAVFVYIYAFSYFRYEPNVERLILLINSFVISMILLVISGNFFVLFLGWELIGLTSFFLINFWSTRMSTVKSAFKAFVFNKISDVALLSVVLLTYFCFNEINISMFNQQISYYNTFFFKLNDFEIPFLELISFFFILCAFIKSAQFGFHIWLPDSMEAPVPASALIHSATLVSAGIFVLLRFSYLFEYSVYAYYIIPVVGSFTAFFGGLCSSYQSDIKKILAYSTISHCGFLMICYSTYIAEYTILYLYIHGFFKAAVFLCVGNVIRFSRNCQDFRRMGYFFKYLPFECFASFLCLINLSGLPFTIGFYIKHLLLIGVYLNNFWLYFIFLNILGGAIFGLIYSYRLFYYVFFDFKKSKKIIYNQANRYGLNSFFYSNTSFASNLAIIGLIVVSYIVSFYLLNIFLNKSSIGEGLVVYSLNSSQYDEFLRPLTTFYNNISYFNWVLLLIIFIIITASWRRVDKYYLVLDYIFYILAFLIFFYIFWKFLT